MTTANEYIEQFHRDLIDRNKDLTIEINTKGINDIVVATKLNHLKSSLMNFIRCLLDTIKLKDEMIDKLNAELDKLRG